MSVQLRLATAVTLIAAGLCWAIARGLDFYGVGPIHIGYDLDQPPLLLVFIGGWLLVRGMRR